MVSIKTKINDVEAGRQVGPVLTYRDIRNVKIENLDISDCQE